MILASSDVASLLHRWEVAEYVSEGFVIVGCAGELVADFFTRLPEKVRKHIGTWSTIVLILALSVGLKCLIKTNELSGSVIGSLGDKAKEAGDKAEDADKKSKQAIVDSGTAQTNVDALTIRVNKASDNLSDIEYQTLLLGPRADLIAGERRKKLVNALKPFRGQKYEIRRIGLIGAINGVPTGVELTADEMDGLKKSLIGVLNEAHWTPLKEVPRSLPPGNGISVEISSAATQSTCRGAVALVKALKEVPLAVSGQTGCDFIPAKRSEAKEADDGIILVVYEKGLPATAISKPSAKH